ncbi:4-demethylwyosine synthase TYW1 [Candidatus Micrarchaeota archaeon]|nr:4-demethylwyosine synthase TYW1 [Candidatus Micrarchaeota archaeon]
MHALISPEDAVRLKRAGYVIVGGHSAVKVCHWTKLSITGKGFCYKQKFYGIPSHRCLQFTPALPFCNHRCLFCWRNTDITIPRWSGNVDEPNDLLEKAVQAQRKLLNGFPGNPETELKKWREAQNPCQAAVSLAGEPTLYPRLPDLLRELNKKGMTSFLVSNGINPSMLEKLADEKALPTQLYVSLCSYNKRIYSRVHRPLVKGGWERLSESLELLDSIKTRRTLRVTLVKGLNFEHPEEYAELIERSGVDYVEVKAYMHVGSSIRRLAEEVMPSHEEINAFATELAGECGYLVSDDHPVSRVVLLSKDKRAEKNRGIKR